MPINNPSPDTATLEAKMGVVDASLAAFQAITPTGTIANRAYANDNNTGTAFNPGGANEYVEFIFLGIVRIKRWRMFGSSTNTNVNGRFRIQYQDLGGAWRDWVTGIPNRQTDDWTAMSSAGGERLCSAVRFECTTYDANGRFAKELEIIF